MDRVRMLSTNFFDYEMPNGVDDVTKGETKKVDPSQRVLRWKNGHFIEFWSWSVSLKNIQLLISVNLIDFEKLNWFSNFSTFSTFLLAYFFKTQYSAWLIKKLIFFFKQAHQKFKCTITVPTIRTMRTYYEKLGNGYVSKSYSFILVKASISNIFLYFHRQIQDPASQRLTWYKPPLAVLVIKKVRDQMVLPPFVQLVEWLIQVSKSLALVLLIVFYFGSEL